MTDLSDSLVVVFGGSGFVGRYIVQRLARRGARIRVALRRPEFAQFLKPMGATGQIQIVRSNLRHPGSVAAAVDGATAVINCVGILAPSGRQTFKAVQADGPRNVAEAAAAASVKKLVQISAIGADPKSDSAYARSKAVGEQTVLEAFPAATILRPSLVFGPEDDFFNRFAAMARLMPALPLIGGETRFQPVYVGDVADAVMAALDKGKTVEGKTFELGGPETLTFRELLERMMDITMVRRPLVNVPMPLAKLQAAVLQFLPKPPLTPDQLRLLARDNVVAEDARTLKTLGVTPTPMASILPTYLKRYRRGGQFASKRAA